MQGYQEYRSNMTGDVTCFTIVARNYLGYALTLGKSLASANPSYKFLIVVADGLSGIETSAYPFSMVDAESICDDKFREMAFRYNVVEFCTSIKPQILRRLMDESQGTVLYLDPDLYICHPLDVIVDAMRDKSICVTPHLLNCKLTEEPYPEYLHLFEGVFNFGFCGVRYSPDAALFLDWWDRNLRQFCYVDHRDGLHTDQKWADYLPCYFGPSLLLLRHPGANVAHWNLGERMLSHTPNGYEVSGAPLLFFHFSGFDYFGAGLVKRGRVETGVAAHAQALARLSHEYRLQLKESGHETFTKLPYAFDKYDNGDMVTHLHRRLYRAQVGSVPNPLSGFHETMSAAGLIDGSVTAAHGYRRQSVPNLAGKIRALETVLRWLFRVIGIRRYTLLIKACEHFARYENHVFLVNPRKPLRPRRASAVSYGDWP